MPARAHPSRPGPRAANVCAWTIQLNPTRCVLRSYLGKAKYILSYQRRRMSEWNSEFYPHPLRTSPPAQMQTCPLRLPTFKLNKWKHGDDKDGNIINIEKKKTCNSDTECHLGRLVSVQSHNMGSLSKYSRAKVPNSGLWTRSDPQCNYIWPMQNY